MESLMRSEARTAITRFGGLTMLVLAAGFGGGLSSTITTTTMTPTTPLSAVTPAPSPSAAPGGPAADGPTSHGGASGVTLTGCIGGLNC